ncbi:hypothetical protein IZ6_20600 [Terrihabitans soli]|uniref:Prolyl oligopeptidase family serine peptidase n=1 Tax=Terrihabitans soli TaxID=708113 RepID=A0A6S6QUT3_9HYPH|nr:hypothetical protein [Terrihabitans soli]BCJ91325.1 hypothetical protein IZ6_20600 [Terrihabitans soli]
MPHLISARRVFCAVFLLFVCTLDTSPALARERLAPQERQCMRKGWEPARLEAAGLTREILWKAPRGAWTKGAILILHGGGGAHFQWCVANSQLVASQVRFAEMAVDAGFAVYLLNSSDQVTDNEGRICGKLWDDEVRSRPNLDLPFIEKIIREIIPQQRPPRSRPDIFLTGLSSGGFMTTRAATHFDTLITAFAPVSSGDPYGWHRICEKGTTERSTVHGKGFDNETGKQIVEPFACRAASYPNEKPWDGTNTKQKPVFRVFGHLEDGIADHSCREKLVRLLREHGYRGDQFVLRGGQRSLENHLWQDEYNRPVLDFFTAASVRR